MRYYVKITKKDPNNGKCQEILKSSALDYAIAMKIIDSAYERHGRDMLAVCLTSDLDRIVGRGPDPERTVWSTQLEGIWNCEACGYSTSIGGHPESLDWHHCPRCGRRISHYEYPDGSIEEAENDVPSHIKKPIHR